MYTCLGIVLPKSGSFRAVIEDNADAGKRALFAEPLFRRLPGPT